MRAIQRRIADNLARVRSRMADAARRSGRPSEAVRLIAVTKYVDVATTAALVEAGCHDLGESRPQQLWQKKDQLADPAIRWHLIGHLQRNKIRRTLPIGAYLHSLDSRRLLEAVDEEAKLADRRVTGLLEVNISGDASKHGLHPDEVQPLVESLPEFSHIDVQGLMAMASLEGGLVEARRDFAALRQLLESLHASCPAASCLQQLSMGMSDDFEIAIEEGATMVRVGSALFEGIGS